jgi:hypothetical protein
MSAQSRVPGEEEMKRRILTATLAGGAVLLSTAAVGGGAVASGYYEAPHSHAVHARLNTLNNSGVTGNATVRVQGKEIDVYYKANGLARKLPHAAHIHYGAQARHECPTVRDDSNHDFRLNVAEGLPEYGPIAVSLTVRGDTSPASALAVDRFSTAPKGKIRYHRVITTSKAVSRAISKGEAVLVIHGVDYNHNGKYDFAGAGKSELNPKLPAEATDPAVCGILR